MFKNAVMSLQAGNVVSIRPYGNSMKGKISSGQLVTLTPIKDQLLVDDIVLCKVKGNYYLHLISATKGEQFQISNNSGYVNGWITKNQIFGRVIKVED